MNLKNTIKPIREIESNFKRRLALTFWIVFVPPICVVFTVFGSFLALFGLAVDYGKEVSSMYREVCFWYRFDVPALWKAPNP